MKGGGINWESMREKNLTSWENLNWSSCHRTYWTPLKKSCINSSISLYVTCLHISLTAWLILVAPHVACMWKSESFLKARAFKSNWVQYASGPHNASVKWWFQDWPPYRGESNLVCWLLHTLLMPKNVFQDIVTLKLWFNSMPNVLLYFCDFLTYRLWKLTLHCLVSVYSFFSSPP